MRDQAEELRKKMNQLQQGVTKNTRIITVTSGKGGVGKSNFSLNFSLSLLQQNKKVLLFDVDVGLGNIDILLGFSAKKTLTEMIEHNLSIWDIIEEGPLGLQFISGGSGFSKLFHLDEARLDHLFDQLKLIQGHVDYIILDTGAGLSPENLRYILAADEVILVTTPEPTSITDAYAVIKMVSLQDPLVRFNLLINRSSSYNEAKQTITKLQHVSKQFLDKEIGSLGFIPDDHKVSQAVKRQNPFILEFSASEVSQAIHMITNRFLDIPVRSPKGVGGFLKKIFTSRRWS